MFHFSYFNELSVIIFFMLFTLRNIGFESFQIKIADCIELHVEERTALETAVAEGLDPVGAVLSCIAARFFVLAQLLH